MRLQKIPRVKEPLHRCFINDDIVKSENFINFLKYWGMYEKVKNQEDTQYYINVVDAKNKISPRCSDYIADIVFERILNLDMFNDKYFYFNDRGAYIKKVIVSKKVKSETVEYTRDI